MNGTLVRNIVLKYTLASANDPLRVINGHMIYMYVAETNQSNNRFLHAFLLSTGETIADITYPKPFNRFFMTDFGIYTVKQESVYPEINNLHLYDFYGNLTLNVLVPFCKQVFASDPSAVSGFVTSSTKFIFVSCDNLVTQYTKQGAFVRQFGTQLGHSVYITSTETSMFALFPNGHVFQYESETGAFVAEYGLPYGQSNNNQVFLVSNGYLFYILCNKTNDRLLGCTGTKKPVLFQWKIQKDDIKDLRTKFTFNAIKNSKTKDLVITHQASVFSSVVNSATFATMFSSETIRNMFQNSFVSADIYEDQQKIKHLLYFSGGGDLSLATCSDGFLHQVTLNPNPEGSKFNYEFTVHTITEDPSWAISEYASIIIKNVEPVLLIHGGITCNLTTVLSTFYLITIYTGPYAYQTLPQNQNIQ
jgi:hypothetical protein